MKNGLRKKEFVSPDWLLLTVSLLLTAIGLLAIYSATAENGISREWKTQVLATGLGMILATVVFFLDVKLTVCSERLLYALCVAVLVFVLLFGTGKEQTGANSWLRFGAFSVQPSEPIKVLFALIFAEKISRLKQNGKLQSMQELGKLVLLFLGVFVPVILQNDTGTALVFLFMFVVMLFAGGLRLRYFVGVAAAFAAAIPIVWMNLAPYQKNRIIVFFCPETDPTGAGYQVLQSKLSIAGGGFFGRGFMQGPNNRFSLLPEKETDFIFGVIGEEFGFLGCTILVLLLFFLCIRCFLIGSNAKEFSAKLACVGIGAMFLFHVTENLCMCIGLLPVTGIPLPFISYGGSAQLTAYLAVGVVQNVYATSKALKF